MAASTTVGIDSLQGAVAVAAKNIAAVVEERRALEAANEVRCERATR